MRRPKRRSLSCKVSLRTSTKKKTEYENVEIVNTVRALVMDKEGILEFLKTMKPAQAKALKTASFGAVKKEDDTNDND